MVNYLRWTPQQDEQLMALILGNKSYHAIAGIMGRSYGACAARAWRLGISKRAPMGVAQIKLRERVQQHRRRRSKRSRSS